jgi:cytochrome c oxidase subunit 3
VLPFLTIDFFYNKQESGRFLKGNSTILTSFHIVDPSPWPITVATSLFYLIFNFVHHIHEYAVPCFVQSAFYFSLFSFLFSVIFWFYDIVTEATFEGHHTQSVQNNIRYGMLLFIISEIMFFFSFFWAFFYISLSPSVWIDGFWPPIGIVCINPFGLPYFNTIILFSSGISLTYAHNALLTTEINETKLQFTNFRAHVFYGLVQTIVLGILFTCIQLYEYTQTVFSIADGIYGSLFFVITGFHGLHVIIGTIFLLVCFFRHVFYHHLREHHVGLECAIWYWHFVDFVWLFVYLFVYLA